MELFIFIKMDLPLNNLQMLICHNPKQTMFTEFAYLYSNMINKKTLKSSSIMTLCQIRLRFWNNYIHTTNNVNTYFHIALLS